MSSLWLKDEKIQERPVTKSLNTTVAVIGGGLSGILTAYFLKEQNIPCILVTKNQIGQGQSGNNTGKITAQHGLIYRHIIDVFGIEKAKQYLYANLEAVETYKKLIQTHNIDCDFEEKSAFLYSEESSSELIDEWNSICRLGYSTSFIPQPQLPFPTKGAIRWDNQGQFHPIKFMAWFLDKLDIYTDSTVTDVKGNRLTVNGHSIHADFIVFACHVPFQGNYFSRMHQSRAYVSAFEHGASLDGMYIGTKESSLSLRNYKDLTLLCGMDHHSGHLKMGGNFSTLEDTAHRLFPRSKLVCQWSAQDGMSQDTVPFIGRFSTLHPNWYVATGFGKWGISTSMVAGRVISDSICGKDSPYGSVFDPLRFPLVSFPPLLELGKDSFIGIGKELFDIPNTSVEQLPKGHGGVVLTNEGKMGVYKSECGEIYKVSIRCPHLGCQLTWNPDEKTWDCPCHGSRFSYKGELLDGPALEGIK